MDTAFSDLLRVDPLTGCKNYLGFLETLTDHSLSDYPADGRSRETLDHFRINASEYSAVLFVAMNDMRVLNATKGRVYGDSVIRWMGILLWRFPVTISIGVASYPAHGENIDALIDKAEYANKRAKEQGKDQVVLAD